jgi:hypothetical protein
LLSPFAHVLLQTLGGVSELAHVAEQPEDGFDTCTAARQIQAICVRRVLRDGRRPYLSDRRASVLRSSGGGKQHRRLYAVHEALLLVLDAQRVGRDLLHQLHQPLDRINHQMIHVIGVSNQQHDDERGGMDEIRRALHRNHVFSQKQSDICVQLTD